MDVKSDQSDEAQGLRLVRAFLSLPPDKRAEVIAFVEELARAAQTNKNRPVVVKTGNR